MALSYSKSCLIGALMECIAYGLYFTYFLQSLRILRRKLVDGRVSIGLAVTSIVLFVLITMRLVLDNKAAVEAFTNDPLTPNAADIYYESFGNGALFRTGTYIALTIVADMFIVYRVYAVWARNIAAVTVPFLLAIADIVSGGLVLQTIRELKAGQSPDGSSLGTHILIFYGFTLSLNVLSTILIATRIYIAQRQQAASKVVPSINLQLTMVIVVESAVLYSVCLIAMLVPTAMSSNAQFCMLSMMPGVVGLAFSLIIVRAGSGIHPHSTAGPDSGMQFAGPRRSQFATSLGERSQFDNMTTTVTTGFTASRSLHPPTENSGIQVQFTLDSHSANTASRSNVAEKEEEFGDQEKPQVQEV